MKSLFLSLVVLPILLLAQSHPIDTTFYNDGSIKNIKFKDGVRVNAPTVRTFKKSNNPYDYNKALFDTLYFDWKGREAWSIFAGTLRIFLHDSSYIYISKRRIGEFSGLYTFNFPDFNHLDVDIGYNQDTTIHTFNVAFYDTSRGGLSFTELFIRSSFREGTRFSSERNSYTTVRCGSYGTVELVFSKLNLLEKIYLYRNHSSDEIYYEFHENFLCKKRGYLHNRVPKGEWVEYHKNGNLSSIGVYQLKISDDGFANSFKDGLWKYFDEYGNLLYDENYLNGEKVSVPNRHRKGKK